MSSSSNLNAKRDIRDSSSYRQYADMSDPVSEKLLLSCRTTDEADAIKKRTRATAKLVAQEKNVINYIDNGDDAKVQGGITAKPLITTGAHTIPGQASPRVASASSSRMGTSSFNRGARTVIVAKQQQNNAGGSATTTPRPNSSPQNTSSSAFFTASPEKPMNNDTDAVSQAVLPKRPGSAASIAALRSAIRSPRNSAPASGTDYSNPLVAVQTPKAIQELQVLAQHRRLLIAEGRSKEAAALTMDSIRAGSVVASPSTISPQSSLGGATPRPPLHPPASTNNGGGGTSSTHRPVASAASARATSSFSRPGTAASSNNNQSYLRSSIDTPAPIPITANGSIGFRASSSIGGASSNRPSSSTAQRTVSGIRELRKESEVDLLSPESSPSERISSSSAGYCVKTAAQEVWSEPVPTYRSFLSGPPPIAAVAHHVIAKTRRRGEDTSLSHFFDANDFDISEDYGNQITAQPPVPAPMYRGTIGEESEWRTLGNLGGDKSTFISPQSRTTEKDTVPHTDRRIGYSIYYRSVRALQELPKLTDDDKLKTTQKAALLEQYKRHQHYMAERVEAKRRARGIRRDMEEAATDRLTKRALHDRRVERDARRMDVGKDVDLSTSDSDAEENLDMVPLMEPCYVLDFDPRARSYTIQWVLNLQEVKVVRPLNLQFPTETEEAFRARVAAAEKLRDAAEAKERLVEYARSYLATESIRPMDEADLERIVANVSTTFPKAHLNLMERCMTEITDDVYNKAVRLAVLLNHLKSHPNRKRLELLRLPPRKDYALQSEQKDIALIGIRPDVTQMRTTIEVIPGVDDRRPDISKVRKFLSTELFVAHDDLYKTARYAVNCWERYEEVLLVVTGWEALAPPLHVSAFHNIQCQRNEFVIRRLKDEWLGNITAAVQNQLSKVFDFMITEPGAFTRSRMCRFLKRINLSLSGQLQGLVYDSLAALTTFFKQLRPDANTITAIKDERSGHGARKSDKYLLRVGCFGDDKILAPKMRAAEEDGDGVPKEPHMLSLAGVNSSVRLVQGIVPLLVLRIDVVDHLLDENNPESATVPLPQSLKENPIASLNNTQQNMATEVGAAAGGDEENAPPSPLRLRKERTKSGNHRLVERIEFVPSLWKVEDAIRSMFYSTLESTDSMLALGPQLFPLLNMDSTYLTEHAKSYRHEDKKVLACEKEMKAMLAENLGGPVALLRLYKDFEYLLDIDLDEYVDDFVHHGEAPKLADFDNICQRLVEHMDLIQKRSLSEVAFPLIKIECRRIKDILTAKAKALIAAILRNLIDNTNKKIDTIDTQFKYVFDKVQEEPRDPVELQALKEYVDSVPQVMKTLNDEFDEITEAVHLLGKYGFMPDQEAFEKYWSSYSWPRKIIIAMDDAPSRLQLFRAQFVAELRERIDKLREDISSATRDCGLLSYEDDSSKSDVVLPRVLALEAKLQRLKAETTLCNEYEKVFQQQPTKWTGLREVEKEFAPFNVLWRVTSDSRELDAWTDVAIDKVDPQQVQLLHGNWMKETNKLVKQLQGEMAFAVVKSVKDRLEAFKPILPLAQALAKPAVLNRRRHVARIAELAGENPKTFDLAGKTLHELVKMGLLNHIAAIVELSKNADQEAKLEAQLSAMKEAWQKVHFSLLPYYDTFLLQSTDGIMDMLDEHIMKTQTMVASPYAAAIMNELKPWEEKLLRISATLNAWLVDQFGVHYLDPIFTHSKDIAKAMPEEARMFEGIRTAWVTLMASVAKAPHVAVRCSDERLLPLFEDNNAKLDHILKELVKYLDTKRAAFPRFYFLSNEDLIEILSQSSDPTLVQPHMRKCFEGIHRLVFTGGEELERLREQNAKEQKEREKGNAAAAAADDGTSPTTTSATSAAAALASANRPPPDPSLTIVTGMKSTMGEIVPFLTEIDPVKQYECVVETWLKVVETRMTETVNSQVVAGVEDYFSCPRTEWVLKWPGQVVTTVSQMVWTLQVEYAIQHAGLHKCETRVKKQLNDLAMLVREDLSAVHLQTLQALIVLDIHARDITTMLYEKQVTSLNDFSWIAQLRYYLEKLPEKKSERQVSGLRRVSVRQTIADLPYGNEYLGNTTRLVITPLTDRCFRALTAAYHLNYGGAPEGPAGTGKTETTKDLAKAIARMCVVFNCSDNIKAQEFEKLLRGLAATGGWGCFDEFNRIETQVLSVIAQQVLSIQIAVAEKKNAFIFEGKLSDLKIGCSIFVTMNPGYAGRSELPDNLQALFRPVAMMVPDYALIAENSLYSCGFLQATSLSKKIVATYKLASEQLSTQSHYDFGMRAVKAVLTSAEGLRKKSPNEPELRIVMRSVRDVNVPKFLTNDAFLFEGIVKDLFGDITLQEADYADLHQGLAATAEDSNLQLSPFFVKKVMQTYEMIKVRHGVMVVGHSIGGKNASLNTLAGGLSWARDKKGTFNQCTIHSINPKSLTMNQLYGYNDASGTEWHDGVLSSTFRTASLEADSTVMNWLVLDGPVDAIWIENMNTVLDDNKKLCLANGDFIRMSAGMTMVFVVQDLLAASPATVSRCGMIYIEPKELGWRPLVQSWLVSMNRTNPNIFHLTEATKNAAATGKRVVSDNDEDQITAGGDEGADGGVPVTALILDTFQTMSEVLLPALLEYMRTQALALPVSEQMLTNQFLLLLRVLTTRILGCTHVPEENLNGPVVVKVDDTAADAATAASQSGGGVDKDSSSLATGIEDGTAGISTPDMEELLLGATAQDVRHYAEALFVYAIVWGVGSLLEKDSGRVQFGQWLYSVVDSDGRRGHLYRPVYPLPDLVGQTSSIFNCKLSIPVGSFIGPASWVDWMSTIPDVPLENEIDIPYHEITVPTPDSVTYDFFSRVLMGANEGVLIVGATGTGKTQIVKGVMRQMALSGHFSTSVVQFSAQTTAANLQFNIERLLERRGGRKYGPPMEKKLVVFVDDLGMPEADRYGTQSPIELLRQFFQHKGWFSTNKSDFGFKSIVDVMCVGAMQPPNAARPAISNRLVRHFFASYLPLQSTETMSRIFRRLMDQIIFQPSMNVGLRSIRDAIVSFAVDVFGTVKDRMLPTPEKSHYTFNLRDLCRVFQGVSCLHPQSCKTEKQLVHLVVHECNREFGDRLTCQSDKRKFEGILRDKLSKHLKHDLSVVLEEETLDTVQYSNLFTHDAADRNYISIGGQMELGREVMEAAIAHHNSVTGGSSQINLVVFDFMIRHVSKVCRIVQQPYGSALLIGLGGSGRRSVARLAALVLNYTVCTVTSARNYNKDCWREDVSFALRSAGERGQSTLFLLVDTEITDESFLEDVSNILNTGEVPGLFAGDNFDPIAHQLKPVLRDAGIEFTMEAAMDCFIGRVKSNMHFALCFSPVDAKLRDRLRRFPALVNCTSIDWVLPWPEEDLYKVGLHKLKEGNIPDDQIERIAGSLVKMFRDSEKAVVEGVSTRTQPISLHVTPTIFLDAVNNFLHLLTNMTEETTKLRDRYEMGLKQMYQTATDVAVMQTTLKTNQPILEAKADEVKVLITEIDGKTAEADKERQEVAVEEEIANKIMTEAKSVKEECEANLAVAMPAMNAATQAVSEIDKKQLVEIKSMPNPPDRVKRVIEAVCIVLGVKPHEKRNPLNGKKEYDYWTPTKTKVMADVEEFRGMLIAYDKDNMDPEIFEKKIIPYISDKHFKPEAVKDVSQALVGVTQWVIAMETYYRVLKIVLPKRQKLALAEGEYERAMAILTQKKEKLRVIDEMLAGLKSRLDDCSSQQAALQEQQQDTETKLNRAVRMIGGLGDEKIRYKEQVETLTRKLGCVQGDALLSSGFVTFLGPFTHNVRMSLLGEWKKVVAAKGLLLSEDYDFALTHTTALQHLQWKQIGLPVDDFSVDSAALVFTTTRYPYLVDPQGQASTWLKSTLRAKMTAAAEAATQAAKRAAASTQDPKEPSPTTKASSSNNKGVPKGVLQSVDPSTFSTPQLLTIRQTDTTFYKQLTNSIQNGHTVVIEDCSERVDPFLLTVLGAVVTEFEGRRVITLGEAAVPYNPSFRLYLISKSARPVFVPEVSTKVCVIGFFTTPSGLADQTVQRIVQFEEKDQVEKRNRMTEQQSYSKAQLVEIEDTILRLISSGDDLLINDAVCDTLDHSRRTTQSIAQRLADGEAFQRSFEKIRSKFVAAAGKISTLFFTVASLANINPMYQFSLDFFMNCLGRALAQAGATVAKSSVADPISSGNSPAVGSAFSDLAEPMTREERALEIVEHFYAELFRSVAQGLFAADHLVYSFLFAAAANGENAEEVSFFASGGVDLPSTAKHPKRPTFIGEAPWAAVVRATEQLSTTSEKLRTLTHDIAVKDKQEGHFALFASKTAFAEREAERQFLNGGTERAGQLIGSNNTDIENTFNTTLGGRTAETTSGEGVNSQAQDDRPIQPIRLGGEWDSTYTPLQKLIITRCLRPDLVTDAVRYYICASQGRRFLEPPTLDVGEVLEAQKGNPTVPLFFVLSSGADPMVTVRSLAERYTMQDNLVTISLGSGMDKRAEEAIRHGLRMGEWVLLQNCHLYKDWMGALDRIIEDYTSTAAAANAASSMSAAANDYLSPARPTPNAVSPMFRLWLTAMPTDTIPATLLQRSIKMVMEPPRGLKANLTNSYSRPPLVEEDFFETSADPSVWKKLAFSLCFLHAVLQERRAYGAIGWNVPYSFNDADLRISLSQVKLFVDLGADLRKADEVGTGGALQRRPSSVKRLNADPVARLNNTELISKYVSFESMQYLIGECNYGGRVTDTHDRRLLNELVLGFINPDMLVSSAHLDASSDDYPMPDAIGGDVAFYSKFISSFPSEPSPGLLGLHENCSMLRNENESNSLLAAVAGTLPRAATASSVPVDAASDEEPTAGATADEKRIAEICTNVLARLRKPYSILQVEAQRPMIGPKADFSNVVLIQELRRFNRLIERVRGSLHALHLAIQGLVVMTAELDSVATDILLSQPPAAWMSASYPTMKPFGGYISDLIARLDVLDKWIEDGPEPVCWLGGLFFPHSFITGVLQDYCRSQKNLTIDRLTWGSRVLEADQEEDAKKNRAPTGWYLGGMLLEGCGWDELRMELREATPGVLVEELPIVHLYPTVLLDDESDSDGERDYQSSEDAASNDGDGDEEKEALRAAAGLTRHVRMRDEDDMSNSQPTHIPTKPLVPMAPTRPKGGKISSSRRQSLEGSLRPTLSSHHFSAIEAAEVSAGGMDPTINLRAAELIRTGSIRRNSTSIVAPPLPDDDDAAALASRPSGDELTTFANPAAAMDEYGYMCPIYRTGARRGVLATTGHSTNYVMSIKLPIPRSTDPAHWTKRGAAIMTSTNH